MNIREGIFLLKEENYKEEYKEFQNNFENLEFGNLILSPTNVFYEEYEKCKEILKYEYLSKVIVIQSKKGEDLKVPYITLRNNELYGICSKDFIINYD